MKKKLGFVTAVFVVALAGVGAEGQQAAGKAQQPAFSVNRAAERIPNLDRVKKEIEEYHACTCKCGCYARDIDVQADGAIAFLRRRAGRENRQEKLAMVLDIDETTLSNYPEMVKADFTYDSAVFDAWVKSAQGPAIAGTLRLYKEAQRLGVSIFFITGRPEGEREATERNLREKGFQDWKGLTLRPEPADRETTVEYKSAARARIAAEGYKIVLNVGDQWSDLKGKPEAEFSVKYPDPFYLIP